MSHVNLRQQASVLAAQKTYERLAARAKRANVHPNDYVITQSIEDAIESTKFILPEQEKYARLIEEEKNGAKKKYLEWASWILGEQLTRAAEEAARRKEIIRSLDTPFKRRQEKERLAGDTVEFFNTWAWTADPRANSPLYTVPFLLFPYQEDGIRWLEKLVYELRSDGLIDKSRDMGVSWLTVGFAAKHWLLQPRQTPFHALFGSRKEEFVDKLGDMSTLFEKIRFTLRHVPSWMLPEGFDIANELGFLRIINRATESSLIGESSNANFGRGGRYTCLVGDTVVSTESGILTFEEALNDTTQFFHGPDGLLKEVKGYLTRPPEPVYEVNTKYGFKIKGTADHPLLVVRSGIEKFVSIQELTSEDKLIVSSLELAPLPTGKKVTPEMARILGYLVSEGSISSKSRVEFSQKPSDVMEDFQAAWESEFSERMPIRHIKRERPDGSLIEYFVSGGSRAKARQRLFQMGLERVKSAHKSIPLSIRTSNRETIKDFLQSLFEGDGSNGVYIHESGVQQFRVSYTSKSETLVRQLQTTLLFFGIFSSIKFEGRRNTYQLIINNEEGVKFAERIGFRSNRKNRIFKNYTRREETLACRFGDNKFAVRAVSVVPAPPEKTYDIHLDGNQFVANGIVSHNCIFYDEHAAFPDGGYQAWTSASQSSPSKISLSTPQGKLSKQAQLRFSGKISTRSYHWSLHPWKDGRWYEGQKLTMTGTEMAQELDINYDASQPGKVFPNYSEIHHVITWKEFAKVYPAAIVRNENNEFVRYRIPPTWSLGRAHDWGSTEKHPSIVMWLAVAKQGGPYAGSVFVYREYQAATGSIPSDLAEAIKERELADNEGHYSRMSLSIMSHEAKSERDTYSREHKLQFIPWDTDYNSGIAQVKDFLKIAEIDKPNPFAIAPLGAPKLMGRPRLYFIVDDNQGELKYNESLNSFERIGPVDSKGLVRLRMELPIYHYPEEEEGKAAGKMRPFKLFDDAIDCLRALAGMWFPAIKSETQQEKLDRIMPDEMKMANILTLPPLEQAAALHAREFQMQALKDSVPRPMHWRSKARAKHRAMAR